ncbi:MAG: DUF1848 domain-containing protein [Methanosphaera sp.]|nr:DUF1848 domain-containing protein [Methanosphaera sp.]
MIFNVSSRSDIVAFYTPWLLNRLEEEYVYTRNPYDKHTVYRYDLSVDNVDSLVFISKNYEPIMDDIGSINDKYNIFCYYTITPYGGDVEPRVPSISESMDTLISLSQIIGKERVAWRFDPLLLTDNYSLEDMINTFDDIASTIHNYTSFVVFSFVDIYDKLKHNMPELIELNDTQRDELIKNLGLISKKYDLDIHSCLVEKNYTQYNVKNTGCITTDILSKANNINFKKIKHEGLREGCKCIKTSDIGAYNSCPAGCKYCYANKNRNAAKHNNRLHEDSSPLLIGDITSNDIIKQIENNKLQIPSNQKTLL